jgi:hypothetical protein
MTDLGRFQLSGPDIAVSCKVHYDVTQERYVATSSSGWHGFSGRSAADAALACFKGWLGDEGGFFEGMPIDAGRTS